MRKTIFLLITFLAILFSMESCIFIGPSIQGNGHVTIEKRKVDNFNKIKVSTGLNVLLVQSDKLLVTIEADENLHEVIRTEMKHDELNIFTDERIRKSKKLRITVEFINLEELRSLAGARIRTDGMIEVNDLKSSASSGSQQSLSINTREFVAKTSSGAQMTVKGKTKEAILDASSGSHLKAGDLVADDCSADVSSGAHIYINVNNDFEGEASSGGHIYYLGNPKSVDINTSSGGEIKKK